MQINIVPLSIAVLCMTLGVIVNSVRRLRVNAISIFEFLFWVGLWLVILFFAFFPNTADFLAGYVGVEHGTELALFVAVLLLFFLHLKSLTRIEKLERQLTTVVRTAALAEKKD